MYLALKHLHLTFIALSFLAFFVRGIWLFLGSHMLAKKWVKILPHIISTFLLVSGILLAHELNMSPGNQPWLMVKIVGLVVYIGLGLATFKVANPKLSKLLWISAMVVFIYIALVAITKNPVVVFG